MKEAKDYLTGNIKERTYTYKTHMPLTPDQKDVLELKGNNYFIMHEEIENRIEVAEAAFHKALKIAFIEGQIDMLVTPKRPTLLELEDELTVLTGKRIEEMV